MQPLGDGPVDLTIKGIVLTGLTSCQRIEVFNEWAAQYCDFYSSLEEASGDLPFACHLPESPLTGPVTAVYVTKASPFPEHRTVSIYFIKGINGPSLSVGRDIFAQTPEAQKRPRWNTFFLRPPGKLRPGRSPKFSKLRQVPGKSPLPRVFKLHNRRIKVLDPFDSYPSGLIWSSSGLLYVLCNGWDDNALSLNELIEIVRYWLCP